jgi:hypothetical protein
MAPVGQILSPSTQLVSVDGDGGIDLTGISSVVGTLAGYFVVSIPFLIPWRIQNLTTIIHLPTYPNQHILVQNFRMQIENQ